MAVKTIFLACVTAFLLIAVVLLTLWRADKAPYALMLLHAFGPQWIQSCGAFLAVQWLVAAAHAALGFSKTTTAIFDEVKHYLGFSFRFALCLLAAEAAITGMPFNPQAWTWPASASAPDTAFALQHLAAAGHNDAGLIRVALAARNNTDVKTLRAMCRRTRQKGAKTPATPDLWRPQKDLGHGICQAFVARDPVIAAGRVLGLGDEPVTLRLAADLLAEGGDITGASFLWRRAERQGDPFAADNADVAQRLRRPFLPRSVPSGTAPFAWSGPGLSGVKRDGAAGEALWHIDAFGTRELIGKSRYGFASWLCLPAVALDAADVSLTMHTPNRAVACVMGLEEKKICQDLPSIEAGPFMPQDAWAWPRAGAPDVCIWGDFVLRLVRPAK